MELSMLSVRRKITRLWVFDRESHKIWAKEWGIVKTRLCGRVFRAMNDRWETQGMVDCIGYKRMIVNL